MTRRLLLVMARALLLGATLTFVADGADAQRRPILRGGQRAAARRGADTVAANRSSLTVGARTRTFLVRAPSGLSRTSAPVPLVLVLHGGGGNAENAERMTGFTALVERERVLVVYPDGSAQQPRANLLTWNAGHCCAAAMKGQVDDVAFMQALIDHLAATYPVDPARIYVTGMSNGAMMSHRVGRELASRIAAIAPVVGTVFGDEALATAPVSAIMINGLLDESVPTDGGPPGGLAKSQWDGTPTRPNEDQGHYWARVNGCATPPATTTERQVISWRWSCPAGVGVELHQIRDGGHAWPGGERGSRRGDRVSDAMNATEVIWAFFKAHPKVSR